VNELLPPALDRFGDELAAAARRLSEPARDGSHHRSSAVGSSSLDHLLPLAGRDRRRSRRPRRALGLLVAAATVVVAVGSYEIDRREPSSVDTSGEESSDGIAPADTSRPDSSAPYSLVGSVAPSIAGPDIDGRSHDLAMMRGQWVVLTFGSTTCVPCVDVARELVDWHRAVDPREVRVLTVLVEDTDPAARDFRTQVGIEWPIVVVDGTSPVRDRFGVEAVPTTFLIDPVGVIRAEYVGGDDPALGDRIDADMARVAAEQRPTGSERAMPDVRGLEYRDALALLAQAGISPEGGVRVLLSLDLDATAPLGTVTRTTTAPGWAVGDELVVHVAATPADLPAPLVGTNRSFPPAGLVAGYLDAPADECDVPGVAEPASAVRFIHGELVGCVATMFIWLDDLELADDPIATMPDVIGLTLGEARRRVGEIDGYGGSYGIGGRDDPNALVLRTRPAAGEPITRLTSVMLEVAPP
jgi:peroxiredoxin